MLTFTPNQNLPITSDLDAFEAEIGYNLPRDYRTFLLKFNTDWPEYPETDDDDLSLGFEVPQDVQADIGKDSFLFNAFNELTLNPNDYGLLQIYKTTTQDWGHLPELLPFARTAGGTHIFICLAGTNIGGIYIASYEYSNKRELGLDLSVEDYCKIAPSFTAFMEILKWSNPFS